MRHIPAIAAMVVALAISSNAQEKPSDEPAKIKELIERLGDDNPHVRDAAQKSLIDLGKTSDAVFPALQATLKTSEDPEVKSRIGDIIKAIGDPEAKKVLLKALENLSKSKGFRFTCTIKAPPMWSFNELGEADTRAKKQVLEFHGIYRPSGISHMTTKADGAGIAPIDIYQIGGSSVYRVVPFNIIHIQVLGRLSAEAMLRMDKPEWQLVNNDLLSPLLSPVIDNALTKMVFGASLAGDEKIGETTCKRFDLIISEDPSRTVLKFFAGEGEMTFTDIRGRIVLDPEHLLPMRMTIDAQQTYAISGTPIENRKKKPFTLLWSFEDQKVDEKVEVPDEVKRLFLGDPAVRKILGDE